MIIVTGASSGLGLSISEALHAAGRNVIGLDLTNVVRPWPTHNCDVSKGNHVRAIAEGFQRHGVEVEALINCAGVNSQDFIKDASEGDWDKLMNVNAKSMFITAKYFLPFLKQSQGTIINIVSNASHLPMTASSAYNASKGAAHILTLQMARELTKLYGISVLGISPAKLKGTGMSRKIESEVCRVRGWTPEFAEEYQKNALLTGEEIPPEVIAEYVSFLLAERNRTFYLSGCIIPFGA